MLCEKKDNAENRKTISGDVAGIWDPTIILPHPKNCSFEHICG